MADFLFTIMKQAMRQMIALSVFIALLVGIIIEPAVIVILIGFGILATVFIWARKLLKNKNT